MTRTSRMTGGAVRGWAVAGLVAGLVALAAGYGGGNSAAAAGGGGRGPSGPRPVEVVAARTDTVVDATTVTGQIEPLQSIEPRPEVDGRIVEIMVQEGALVSAGAPLFRINDAELRAQVDRAKADRDHAVQAPERFAEQLAVGQTVDFRVAALTGRVFSGVVDFVDPVVQRPGRTITIKARVANPRRELSSGMFFEARLVTEVRPNATIIPEDALMPLPGGNAIWVVADGRATRRMIETGLRTTGFVEVRGVAQVVVSGASG